MIKVEDMLNITNPDQYKIHFAVWNGEEQPLDVFVRDRDDWKSWNRYRGKQNDFNRKFIFSLIRYYPLQDKWLFGGIFRVVERMEDKYLINLEKESNEFIGRMLIHHPGPGVPGRSFLLENFYSKLLVSQIFEDSYSGEAFCGYENIEHGFSELEAIFNQNKQDWKTALQNVKGIYLITDSNNGKMYVGSAYNESGIWSRWKSYLSNGHGGNKDLKSVLNTKGIDYAKKHFRFSLLEYYSMKTDKQVIIDRELYWKRVLLSNDFGYNKN